MFFLFYQLKCKVCYALIFFLNTLIERFIYFIFYILLLLYRELYSKVTFLRVYLKPVTTECAYKTRILIFGDNRVMAVKMLVVRLFPGRGAVYGLRFVNWELSF